MIRPLTIATCLLACGSGLYLYQSKHQVSVLDRTIERTVHDTNALREQSRLLAAEWTMLNDPQRLQQFSETYLTLKSIAPTQFTSLADLDSRLPAPQPEAPPAAEPSPGTDEQAPAAVVADVASTDAADPASDAAVVADDALPVPPIPAMPAMPKPATVAAVAHADTRTAERTPVSRAADNPSRSVAIADARPFDQRPNLQRQFDPRPSEPRQFEPRQAEQRVVPRVVEARAEIRPAPPSRPIMLAAPRPSPAYAPVNTPTRQQYRPPMVAESTPYGGSLLGMARGSAPPAPRPTPVSASYNAD